MFCALKAVTKFKRAIRELRVQVTEEEREFMNQVTEKDDRFEGKIQKLSEDMKGGSDTGSPMTKSPTSDNYAKMFRQFGRDCIRMCWEIVEKDRLDLERTSTQLTKVSKAQKEQQKAYFEEIVGLRDQCRRNQDVNWDDRELTRYFYEPLTYLDDDTQDHVKNVVNEKVKVELLKNSNGKIPSHILEEIAGIEKMKLEFDETLAAKNTVVENLNALLKSSAKDLERKDQILAEKENERKEILRKYEDFDRILSEYEQAADAAKEEAAASKKEMAKMKKDLEKAELEMAELGRAPSPKSPTTPGVDPEQMEYIKQELDRARREKAEAEKQIALQKQELDRNAEFARQLEQGGDAALQAAIQQKVAAEEESARLRDELSQQVQMGHEENERLREESERLRAELRQLLESTDASEREEILRSERDNLKEKVDNLREEVANLQAELGNMRQTGPVVVEVEKKRTSVDMGVGELSIDSPRCSPRPKRPESPKPKEEPEPRTRLGCVSCKELRAKLEALEGSLQGSQNDFLNEKDRAARDRAASKERERELQERAAEELRQIGEGKDLEIARLQEENRSLDEENARLHGQVADLEMKLAQLRDRLREGGDKEVDKALIEEIEQALAGKPAWKNIWEKLHQDAVERFARLEQRIKDLRLSDMSEWDYRRKIHEAFVEALTLWFRNPNPPYAMPQPPRFSPNRQHDDSYDRPAPALATQVIDSPMVSSSYPSSHRKRQMLAAFATTDGFFPHSPLQNTDRENPEKIFVDAQRPKSESYAQQQVLRGDTTSPVLLDQCIPVDGPLQGSNVSEGALKSSNASEGEFMVSSPALTFKKLKAPGSLSPKQGQVVSPSSGHPMSIVSTSPSPSPSSAFLTQGAQEEHLLLSNEHPERSPKHRSNAAEPPEAQAKQSKLFPQFPQVGDATDVHHQLQKLREPSYSSSPQMSKTQSLPALPPADSRRQRVPGPSLMEYPYLRVHPVQGTTPLTPPRLGESTKVEGVILARAMTASKVDVQSESSPLFIRKPGKLEASIGARAMTSSKIDGQSEPAAASLLARKPGKRPENLQNIARVPRDFTGLTVQRYEVKKVSPDIMAVVSPPPADTAPPPEPPTPPYDSTTHNLARHGSTVDNIAANVALRRHKLRSPAPLR